MIVEQSNFEQFTPTHIYNETKQWPLAPNSQKWRITRANVSRRVTFLSKMAFGECGRVWRASQMATFWRMRVWRVFKMLLASLANLGTYIS
jgi:hypothetical protein